MSDWINRSRGKEMSHNVLSGRKQISSFVKRSWNTVAGWIREKDFPATKIDGVWESQAELIAAWREEMIERGCNRREQI